MRSLSPVLLLAFSAFSFSGVSKCTVHAGENYWNCSFSIRLAERWSPGFARFETAWAVSPSLGNPAVPGPDDNYSSYRIADLPSRIIPDDWEGDENFSLLQNLDRLSLQFRSGKLRVTAGRQAVYWGISRTVSPTDFIAPFPYGTIDTEYRVGVDALRAVYPLGMLSQVESGAVFGEGFTGNGYWARSRFYAMKTDFTVLGALFDGTFMTGGSVNRALGGAVGWLEGAWNRHDSGTAWWNLSSGVERSFLESRLYGFAEYHFNSAGSEDPGEYDQLYSTEPYSNGTIYLAGKHYAGAGVSFNVTPLITLSAGTLLNTGDLSARMDVSGAYSISENGSLEAGVSGGIGSGEDEFAGLTMDIYALYALYFQ